MLAAAAVVAFVVAWAILVALAQVLNPEQSPLSLGMSGLARGKEPWVMKSSFIARGLSALLLIAALPAQLHVAGLVLLAVALLWVWGVGSATLALADTDMPGEAPTRAGAAHALIALVAYVAGAAGAILLSFAMLNGALSGVAAWALAISVSAAVALVVQFVAFGAAAREARVSAPAPLAAGSPASPASTVVREAGAGVPSSPAVAQPLAAGVPPQLGAGSRAVEGAVRGARPPAAPTGALHDLASYAGLYQRIFVGLLMAWTMLVALGLIAS